MRARMILGLAVALCASIIPAPFASAATVTSRAYLSSFDGSATPVGTFSSPGHMAIDQGTDTLYVLDVGNGVLDKFDLSTDPPTPAAFSAIGTSALDGAGNSECETVPADCDQTPTGNLGLSSLADIAVDESGTATDGRIYVSSESEPRNVFAFAASGEFLFALDQGAVGDSCGVAVDSSGAIRVSEANSATVRRFVPDGESATRDPSGDVATGEIPCDLAIDSGDRLYVGYYFGGLDRFSPSGANLGRLDSGNVIGIDPDSDEAFVDRGAQIAQYGPEGEPISRFGDGTLTSSAGLAINAATGILYASDAGANRVHVFEPTSVTVPDLTIEAPETEAFSATLKGTVDPLGQPTTYHFQYRLKGAGEWTETEEQAVGAAGPISAAIAGLKANTAYESRLLAENIAADAFNATAIVNFTTDPLAPILLTSPAAEPTQTTATLNAKLIPGGPETTTYSFQWGLTEAYGSQTPLTGEADAPGSGNDPVLVSQELTGLDPATTYHFRIVATNSQGTVSGPDRTFKTLDPYPGEGLPDGRVYERVTPQEKGGADAERVVEEGGLPLLYQASTDGEKFAWTSSGNIGGDGGPAYIQYLSTRTASGWSTSGLSPRMSPRPVAPTKHSMVGFPKIFPRRRSRPVRHSIQVTQMELVGWRTFSFTCVTPPR